MLPPFTALDAPECGTALELAVLVAELLLVLLADLLADELPLELLDEAEVELDLSVEEVFAVDVGAEEEEIEAGI